jgi:hypothetical protein
MTPKKDIHEIGKDLLSLGKKGIKKVKEGAYAAAAGIEQTLNNPEPVMKEAGKLVKKVIEGGKALHDSVQKQGGYGKLARKVGSEILKEGKQIYESARGTGEKLYKEFEDAFFTNGEFDSEKAKILLDKKGDELKKFGREAAKEIGEIVRTGADNIKRDYRNFVPSNEELNTKYRGIGTSYGSILLRQRCEGCLKYHKEAKSKLPLSLKSRNGILRDIKSSASYNKEDLTGFYTERKEEVKDGARKLKIVQRYL